MCIESNKPLLGFRLSICHVCALVFMPNNIFLNFNLNLKSFIGARTAAMSHVLNGYAALVQPLEQVTAGKQSRDHIV